MDEIVVPEGMMLIADHQQAMLDLRAELAEAANTQQAEILMLQGQLRDQGVASQLSLDQANQSLVAMTTARDQLQDELAGLRVDFMNVVAKTDDGKQAMKRFEGYLTDIQIGGLQQQVATLQQHKTELGS